MSSRAVSARCTLYLRHETRRRPGGKHQSLTQISYVDSFRPVERPEFGKAAETVVCNECGRSVEFTVFSVKRTRQMRAWRLVLLLILVTLLALGALSLIYACSNPGWAYIDTLPLWVLIALIVAGMASLWIIPFSHFYWSDEFGIRSRHRWRYTHQMVVSDELRGSFVAKCEGTWDDWDPSRGFTA